MRSLAPPIRTEAVGRIIETNPGAHHNIRVHHHEPRILTVLRGPRLSGQIVGAQPILPVNASPRSLLNDAAQHIHHRIGGGLGERLSRRRVGLKEHIPALIFNAPDERGLVEQAPVGKRGVGRGQFKQVHIRDTEGQCRYLGQGRSDAHATRVKRHIGRTHLQNQPRRHRVDGPGQCLPERQHLSRGHGARVARAPDIARNVHIRQAVVEQCVIGRKPIVDGRRVEERLERGARLPLRNGHLVVPLAVQLPSPDPGLDKARLRVHGHKTDLGARFDAFQRIHERLIFLQRCHGFVPRKAGPSVASVMFGSGNGAFEHLHILLEKRRPWAKIHIVFDRQVITGLRGPHPRIAAGLAPFKVRYRLEAGHERIHGRLRHGLHARIQRRVGNQAVVVDVVAVLFGPQAQLLAHFFGIMRGDGLRNGR